MDKNLIIDVARLDPEGETLEGEVDVIDVEEELVHPFGGVRYRLDAQVFGTELLVRGHLEQDFTLVCSRCGKDFDMTVKVDGFTASFEVSEGQQEIDISEDVREGVLLELPAYPLCDEACEGLAQSEAGKDAGAGCWGALDALKVGGKKG